MAITLDINSLGSRAMRKKVVSGGVRRIATSSFTTKKDDNGNIIQKLFDAAARFVGFLVGKFFGGLGWGLSTLWGWFTSARQFLWNFNWNASDAELDAGVKQSFNALGGVLGGALGNAVGWLACGVIPSATIFAFNEALGLYLLKEVGEEALEELAANAANVIRASMNTLSRAAFVYAYKKLRKWWLGERAGTTEQKPWSFAKAVEDRIEAIPNEFLRNFAEEFLEEADEACIEAGYVAAGSIDSYMAQQKIANQGLLGIPATVEITFDRSQDDDATPSSGG